MKIREAFERVKKLFKPKTNLDWVCIGLIIGLLLGWLIGLLAGYKLGAS